MYPYMTKIDHAIAGLPSQDILESESEDSHESEGEDWNVNLPSSSEDDIEYEYGNDNPYIEKMERNRSSAKPSEPINQPQPKLVLVTGDEPSQSGNDKTQIETIDLEEPEPVKQKAAKSKHKHGGGRQKSKIWEEYTELDDKTWKCNKCDQIYKHPQADRLEKHQTKCSGKKRSNLGTNLSASTPCIEPVELITHFNRPSVPTKQQKLEECVPKTSPLLKKRIDEAMLRMVCSINSSFNIFENPHVKYVFNLLRPTYELPTRKFMANTMLDSVYCSEMSKFAATVRRKRATILQDGWKAPQGDCVIAHSLTIDGKNYFFKSHVMGEEKKTSENCLRLLIQAIEQAEAMGVHVTSCVTDNCASMNLMRAMLKKRMPNILTYGCNSHLLNLIGKKITPEDMLQKVVEVQKYISNHDITKAALKNARGLSPILPADTRWNSQLSCLENYYKNHTKYLEISRRDDFTMSSKIVETLENQNVIPEVKALIQLLKPVAISLDLLQSDSATVAEAVHCWLGLLRDSKLGQRSNDGSYFEEKFKEGTPDFSIAAYMVHPKYQGKNLTLEMTTIGRQYIRDKDKKFLPIVLAFKNMNAKTFSSMLFEDDVLTMDPVCCWNTAHSDNPEEITQDFLNLVSILLTLPSSTAGIERNFSTLGAIYSDPHRNQLSLEKADKICFIKNSLGK